MRKRILIVDDTAVIRDLLRLILETDGYDVSEANHGGEAIARMRDALPDLVITDLMMPVMTGQQLIRRLRSNERFARLPILVLSANPKAAQMAKQADAVVRLPFDRADLVEQVRKLIHRQAEPANQEAARDDAIVEWSWL